MAQTRTKSDWPDPQLESQYDWFLEQHPVEGPTIDADKPLCYVERLKEARFSTQLIAIFLVGFVAPVAVLVVGIVSLAVWTAISRH